MSISKMLQPISSSMDWAKVSYVLEYSYRISRAGMYETGLATIQSAYAPEYVSHSASMKVTIK